MKVVSELMPNLLVILKRSHQSLICQSVEWHVNGKKIWGDINPTTRSLVCCPLLGTEVHLTMVINRAGLGGTAHSPSSGRCCVEMNEAISHCVQVTDLPELVTSIGDKEITHLSSSLPHSALSSPTWINDALCQPLLAKEKKGKTGRE